MSSACNHFAMKGFNSGWGRYDAGRPRAWLLNVAPLIDGENQRRAAETTLRAVKLLSDLRSTSMFVPEIWNERDNPRAATRSAGSREMSRPAKRMSPASGANMPEEER